MSSIAYSAELQPDPRLRRLVACSGLLLCLGGIVLILQLPTDLWMRLAASALWAATCAREQRESWRGWANCHTLRFTAEGHIAILGPDQVWRPARRESGSVLLGRVGWIRLRDHRGAVFGELLTGDGRASTDWRRLQVIWRHVGA